MQFQIISLIFAAAAVANAAAVVAPPYSYGTVCSSEQVAVCCQADGGYTVDSDTCLRAGNPKRLHRFENKCAAKGYGYAAYCCEYSYGEYINCVKE